MRTLTDDDLSHLGSFERELYHAILECVPSSAGAPLLAESSGFELAFDDIGGDAEPYWVRFDFRAWEDEQCHVSGVFGRFPEGLSVFVHMARMRVDWFVDVGPQRSAADCIVEARGFFEDLFKGRVSVVTRLAGSCRYQWKLVRRDQLLSSGRCLIYPYWRKRCTVVRRLPFARE